MHNSYSHIILILLFLTTSSSTVEPCRESDYEQYFTECDPKTNTRNVTIYLSKDCENVQVTDESSPLSFLSTLPTTTVQCGLKCPAGEIMKLDPLKKELICVKCPKDSYSVGGDLRIRNRWSNEDLKKFEINCYAIGTNDYSKNTDCTGLSINNDKTMIMSGELTGNYLKYFIQVMYFFKAKNPGRVILQYKKDSEKELTYNNGDFKFFFDYEYVAGDSEPDSPWRTVYHDFKPGDHEIVFFYWYIKTKKPLRFYIKSFEVIGIEDAAFKCEKCINSIAPEGSDHCYSCQSNFYYDTYKEDCVACPDGQFSISNSFGDNSCMAKKICSTYEYELVSASECVDGKKTVTYKAIEPVYCLDGNSLNRTETVDCALEKNDEENKCGPGKFKISSFDFNFQTTPLDSFFTENTGWKSNGNEIFSGIYINENVEKILTKTFKIESVNAYMEVSLSLNLDKDEIFKIKTNKEAITFSNTKDLINQHIDLFKGENTLQFIYEKTSSAIKIVNGVSILSLQILGSDLSDEIKFQKCPIGTIALKACDKCVECKPDEIPDKNQTTCIKCQNGIHQIINGESVCSECPSYTYLNNSKCILNDILYQEEAKLKFNIAPLKEWLDKICNDQSGILCYENSFIGPISKDVKANSTGAHDLFFISLFEPKEVNLYDFSYNEDSTKNKRGHIFGLFSVNNPVVEEGANNNSDVFFDHNITFTNTKIKKNLATNVKNVSLVGKNHHPYQRLGVVVEYNEGDTCLSDPRKKYKTYLYLKCNKYDISTPQLKKVSQNGCTFIFEWTSPYLCKNCITSEITNYERGACKNNQRQVIFSSNDDCLIFNGSNPELIGYDKPTNETLLTESSLIFQLLSSPMRILNDVITVKGEDNNTFPFEFIESKVYYEPCTFIDNIDKNWKKYLLIIPVLYIITLVLVICYCCKYRRIKSEYEKLRSSDNSHSETNSKDFGKDNALHLEPDTKQDK